MRNIFTICIALFIFIPSMYLFAEERSFRIVSSRDLKGNVKSCTCTTIPIAGIEGRASFLESIKIDPSRDILIETGDYLGSGVPMDKYPAIFESFLGMGYHFLGIGVSEVKNSSKDSWEKFIYSPVSSNLTYSPKDGSFKKMDSVFRNGKEIKFLSILFPSKIETIGETYSSGLYYTDPKAFFLQILPDTKADLWIISLWGSEKEIESIQYPTHFKNTLTIINKESGNKKQTPKNIKKLGTVVWLGMENGDEISILEVNKNFSIERQKIQTLEAEKFSQNEKISGIIKKYNIR
jgi:hypothetical protein